MFWDLFKERFKSKAQKQELADDKKRQMCALAVRTMVCPKCCCICAYNVKGQGAPNLTN